MTFDPEHGLVELGKRGHHASAQVMDIELDLDREVAWLDEMCDAARWLDEEVYQNRSERAEDMALHCSSWAMFVERDRSDLKSDLSHSHRSNAWLRRFALGDLERKLSVLAPCYAVIAAGHKKRLDRAQQMEQRREQEQGR